MIGLKMHGLAERIRGPSMLFDWGSVDTDCVGIHIGCRGRSWFLRDV